MSEAVDYAQFASEQEAKAHYYAHDNGPVERIQWIWVSSYLGLHWYELTDEWLSSMRDWRDQIMYCAWRQEFRNELDLIITGAVPEGATVSYAVMRYVVKFGYCDMIEAFLPHLEEISDDEYSWILGAIHSPNVLPMLDKLLDHRPLAHQCFQTLTAQWLLPHTILKLLAQPHAEVVKYAQTESYEFLHAHGVSFDQPEYLIELLCGIYTFSDPPTRICFIFAHTTPTPDVIEAAQLSEMYLVLFDSEERRALRPELQTALAARELHTFRHRIRPSDIPLLPYGALICFAVIARCHTYRSDIIYRVRQLGLERAMKWASAAKISNECLYSIF